MAMLLALLFLVAQVRAQPFQVPTALVEPLQPSGIRISIPDSDGLELFAVHANLNKPIKELESGDLSKDILQPENGRWVYQNDRIRLKPGDTVNYWIYVQKNKMGYRKDNISWTYRGNDLLPGTEGSQGQGGSFGIPSRPPPGPQGPLGPSGSFGPDQPLPPPVGGFEVPSFTTTTEPFPTLATVTAAALPTIRPPTLPPLPPPPPPGGAGFAGRPFGVGDGGGNERREEELHQLRLQLLRQILILRGDEADAEQRRLQELHQLRLRHLEELHQEELKHLRQSNGQQRPVWRF